MSQESIKIYRALPVINGYVQVPPNLETNKSVVTEVQAANTIAGSGLYWLSLGSGDDTGSKFGAQQLLIMPPLSLGRSYQSEYGYDPVQLLGGN